MTYLIHRPIVYAGPTLTAGGWETGFAFAAGALLIDPGSGGMTYAWSIAAASDVPAGSAITTASIGTPTSLTGATLTPAWDRPGTYVFTLTGTDSAGRTSVSRVSVRVGTSEGYMAVRRIRWATLANRNIKTEGDGAKTFVDGGSLSLTLVGTANMTSLDIVNGTGLVGVHAAVSGFCTWAYPNIQTLYPRAGRAGTYALLVSGSLSGVNAGGYEHSGIGYWDAAGSQYLRCSHGFAYGGHRRTFRTLIGSSDISLSDTNGIYRRGLIVTGYDVRAFLEQGAAWPDDPVLDGATPTWTGAVIQSIAPGGTCAYNWTTDWWQYWYESAGGGGAFTDTITDVQVLWKP
jgi:hypothetical protein